MLTKAEIEKNKETFCFIYKEAIMPREGDVALYEWILNSTFFEEPASTMYHENYKGGLCEHTLKVYDMLTDICYQNTHLRYPFKHKELATVALLHDICKVGVYKERYRNVKSYERSDINAAQKWQVKNDEQGDFVWVSRKEYYFDDDFPLGHGEKSMFIASKFLKLTDDEAMAIRFHMGAWDDGDKRPLSKAFEICPLAVMLHMADTYATYLYNVPYEHEEKVIMNED